MFIVFFMSSGIMSAVFISTSVFLSLRFLEFREKGCNHSIYDIRKEHLVDNESDGENDNRRNVRSDEREKKRISELSIKSEIFYKRKSTIGMNENITLLHESEKYRSEKENEDTADQKCLKHLPENAPGEAYRNPTVYGNEYGEDEYEVYR